MNEDERKRVELGQIVDVLYEGDPDPIKIMILKEAQVAEKRKLVEEMGVTVVSAKTPLAIALLGMPYGNTVQLDVNGDFQKITIVDAGKTEHV